MQFLGPSPQPQLVLARPLHLQKQCMTYRRGAGTERLLTARHLWTGSAANAHQLAASDSVSLDRFDVLNQLEH